ncbi:hypothetical protein [Saccharothrix texasensis]|uniref:hypothetical protein n=1 Tax=Saccharothrix texasensis TaxID=103734 RepID=UPI0011CD91B0|nr:hypothetical protein [Saccharothrix texasensis]
MSRGRTPPRRPGVAVSAAWRCRRRGGVGGAPDVPDVPSTVVPGSPPVDSASPEAARRHTIGGRSGASTSPPAPPDRTYPGQAGIAVLCALAGAVLIQLGCASGPADLVVAGRTVVNPIVAAVIGVVLLDETGAPGVAS